MSEININNEKNIENENSNFKIQRRSTGKSFFLVEGKILNINPKDKKIHTGYFDFKNFIFNPNLDKIGSGAFGDVYLAINKIDKKKYAIKHILKKRVLENNCSLSIIYKEIETQIIIDHPNIIRLYSYYENNDNIYLILEYLNKGTLFSKIRKKKKLSEKESFNYFIQILNAINFLHENHFVHRDIKPENILLDSNDNVKLCDFGWCVNLKKNETRKTFCGTFEYMAPEIVYEENYDTSVDIWALGILLYEMLHGYSPFRAKDNLIGDDAYKDIFRNIMKLDFTIDRNDLSQQCKDIIYKLLESEKDKRICSKEIFAQDWVKMFEKEKKKEIIRESQNKKNNSNINCNSNNNSNINSNINRNNFINNDNFNHDDNNYFSNNKKDEDKKNRERIINSLKEQQNDFFKENEDEIKERRRKEEEKKKRDEEKKRKEEEERKLIEKDIQNGYKPLIKKKSKSTDLLCDDFYENNNNNNNIIKNNNNNNNNNIKNINNNNNINEEEFFDDVLSKVKKVNKKVKKKKRDLSQLSIKEKNLIKNKSTFNVSSKHTKKNKNSFENYINNDSNENNNCNNNFLNIHNNNNNINHNRSKFSNMSNIKNEHSNLYDEMIESSFVKDVVEIDALETTKASSKKGNNYYNFYNPNELNTNDVYYTLKILEKAENESQKMKDDKKIKKKEESFIDKILKPFKCGD